MIIADRIAGRDNPWSKTFDSTRLAVGASIRQLITENLEVGKRFIADRLASWRPTSADELEAGEVGSSSWPGRPSPRSATRKGGLPPSLRRAHTWAAAWPSTRPNDRTVPATAHASTPTDTSSRVQPSRTSRQSTTAEPNSDRASPRRRGDWVDEAAGVAQFVSSRWTATAAHNVASSSGRPGGGRRRADIDEGPPLAAAPRWSSPTSEANQRSPKKSPLGERASTMPSVRNKTLSSRLSRRTVGVGSDPNPAGFVGGQLISSGARPALSHSGGDAQR